MLDPVLVSVIFLIVVALAFDFINGFHHAADAVNLLKPVVAIPIHYGDIVVSLADAKKFEEY